MIKYILLLVLVVFVSCGESARVKLVLERSGSNREKIAEVIDYFHGQGNDEMIKAAQFLIENMDGHFSYDGEEVTRFDVIYDFLDSLHKRKVKVFTASPILNNKWDSLVNQYGIPISWEAEEFYDHENMKSDLLINNINWAYKTWKNVPWAKGVSFIDFCKFLLPYRNGTERLEPWREHLFNEFKKFRDTVKWVNRFDVASQLNGELRKQIALNHTMRKYPFDMNVSQMEKARRGACKQLVFYTANCMRANGIPVGVDFAPCWGDLDRGHEWNVLLKENGTMFPFNAASADFSEFTKTPYRLSKVFRMSFALVETQHPSTDEVPASLINDHAIDVTEEYTKCFNPEIELTKPNAFNNKYALICTYKAKGWAAQDWGEIQSNNTVKFNKIGCNILYIVMYYKGGNYYPASAPFILENTGRLQYILPDSKKTDVLLLRKYPYFPINTVNAKPMIGAKIQVANKSDFSDSVTVFTIAEIPVQMVDIMPANKLKYRYVRFLTATGHKTNLAELNVYGVENGNEAKLKGKIVGAPEISDEQGTPYQNAFDGNLETYFSGDPDTVSWAGMDLGSQRSITKIQFCPRSDVNFIVAGDNYELSFWNGLQWQSLGKQVATRQSLSFKDVPDGQIYILHNLSRGKEERIFTYKNGKQIWW